MVCILRSFKCETSNQGLWVDNGGSLLNGEVFQEEGAQLHNSSEVEAGATSIRAIGWRQESVSTREITPYNA